MKASVLAVALLLSTFFASNPVRAQHIGFSGHMGGGFSGRGFSGRGLSGRSVGHAFARMVGHHSGARSLGRARGVAPSEEPPLAGAVFLHGRVMHMQNPNSVPISAVRRPPRLPAVEFFFGQTVPSVRFHHFGTTFCGGFFPFPERHIFFPGGCFDDRFFLDPFFFGGFFGARTRFHGFLAGSVVDLIGGAFDPDSIESPVMPEESDAPRDAPRDPADPIPAERPVTLLQLTDGSMYGLTDYWLEAGELHYVTSYGGKNSLPLKRVDLEATQRLNAERGVSFAPRPKSSE